jgi:hypothetical protein
MDDDGLRVLQWYPSADDAQRAASVLVEHGIGAAVERTPTEDQFGVALLPGDVDRGRQILGLPDEATSEDDAMAQLRGSTRTVLLPVLLAAAVLVLVPLLAFFVTFKLSGG